MFDFEQKLNQISKNDRRLLQCLAIAWEPITSPEFSSLIKQLGLKTPEGRGFKIQYLSHFRKSLFHKGILRNIKEYWGSGFQISDERLKEVLTREAFREDWFDETVRTIQEYFPLEAYSNWYYQRERRKNRLLRDFRLSIYLGRTDKTAGYLKQIEENELTEKSREMLRQIFSNPFQNEFLKQFSTEFQIQILTFLFERTIELSGSTAPLWDFVRDQKITDPALTGFEIDELILRGDLKKAKTEIRTPDTFQKLLAAGTIALIERDFNSSIQHFEAAIAVWKKLKRKRKGFPGVGQMFFYGLALYKSEESSFYSFSENFYTYCSNNYPDFSGFRAIRAIEYFLKNNDDYAAVEMDRIKPVLFWDKFVVAVTAAIIPKLKMPAFAKSFATENQELGYKWVELELRNLLASKENQSRDDSRKIAEQIEADLGIEPVGRIIPPMEDWERVLGVLTAVAENIGGQKETTARVNETRVAWQIDFNRNQIQPVEQKYSKTGWTKGRNIALKRLFEQDVKNLTEQDSRVVKNAMYRERNYSYYGAESFDFYWDEAMLALAGHPFLFLMKNPAINVQLVKTEPALIVREINDDLEIKFDTDFTDELCVVHKETETRYKVVEIDERHIIINSSLPKNKLKIPARGRPALMKAIQPLSAKIAIQSDLEEHFETLPAVEADPAIHALITPFGEGFHLEFFVKPFKTIPPYFKPGKGAESVIADLDGVRTRTKRDLKNERKYLNEIEEICPFLAGFETPNYEWHFADPEACLNALTELETPRNEGKLVIEWPKGEKLRIVGQINFENLSLSVKGTKTWFEVDGTVRINEELVLSMRELTKLLDRGTGDFIELSDGQFIAITEKLRKHLQTLNSVLDNKNRLHNLRSGILEELSGELQNFKANKAWKEHLNRIKKAHNFVPELPTTFEADLRPYQIEGYFWLSRLAQWGVGACLADDMGLGKTLQALAVLVDRAELGPALVVAPVSVLRNWVQEARRFSPTLNFHIFGDGDRRKAVESLGKYDVLVASYNLLQVEEELFVEQKFATIVLDEAQAIKNRNTKRSKTVMQLQGDFRLITTGTPIENHLGELWNLFNFINPGLLGSHEFFNQKFAIPIEKEKNEETRKTLQRLIQPFILRRRKNQVLDDLPEKTEIRLTVEMSPEERAFYEAIRREALERIESQDGEIKDKRFRIFAELMRLRLACCHPKLVNENVSLPSSKLDLFGETLEELLENKHKALVFSQFVKHLGIVKEYLKKKNISYQYLDGSTPAKKRQERIDAFQRGTGEVFLISLKAGGTGLNLTAADYVIHLDPWWNPAVEDQATDRVHRIGQQRPVTVYRLVTENTVEEKILKLHETKRDLADSLLAGTDSSSKLSVDDLLALIKEV